LIAAFFLVASTYCLANFIRCRQRTASWPASGGRRSPSPPRRPRWWVATSAAAWIAFLALAVLGQGSRDLKAGPREQRSAAGWGLARVAGV